MSPASLPRGEAGLLGLAVSPNFAQDQTVFAYVTTEADNRVVATRFDGDALTDQRLILTGIPATPIHDGGHILFGPDGMLYVTTGDAGNSGLAQDMSSLGGKILRIEPDGSIPADNPDPASSTSTGACGRLSRRPTGRCGSPPAIATGVEILVMATTVWSASGPTP